MKKLLALMLSIMLAAALSTTALAAACVYGPCYHNGMNFQHTAIEFTPTGHKVVGCC